MSSTVLVVEDNPITRKLVHFALAAQGISVVDAPDAATAIRAFSAQSISLVLQDLILPDMDGVELVRRLRALPEGSSVPILAVSGMLSKGDEVRYAAAGFNDVVMKPVEPARLVQIVRAHLPSEPLAIPHGSRRRVVLADDDAVQRKLAMYRLQRAGYDVVAVGDGIEALERARELRPHVIVSDVLMPRLDGFGLCIEVRRDPILTDTPILLVTNSYLEAADRDLAKRVGATDYVLRTPELAEVISALTAALGRPSQNLAPAPLDPEVERERTVRAMKQLERQVALNAGANQRAALLAAEVSVLSAISEAVATEHDTEAALRQALAACFDAGGISMGALYLVENGARRVVPCGPAPGWAPDALDTFFGHATILQAVIDAQAMLTLPSTAVPRDVGAEILERAQASSLVTLPLGHRGAKLGALLMVSRSTDLQTSDRLVFAQAVAGQISQALALARAFAAKDASERAERANARVLRSILESMADGVIVTDEDGTIRTWNRAAEGLLGLHPAPGERESWTGREGVFGADQTTPLTPAQDPVVQAQRGRTVQRAELFVRHADKPTGAWLSVSARPLRDDTNTIGLFPGSTGGVAVFRDVTAEKSANTQLMISDRMASLGALAAGVGHEINNPLAAVIANLDLALADVEQLEENSGELTDELRDAREAADRVRQIVKDLKLFSRAEEETTGPVSLERVLESSLRMAWTEIRHRARLVRAYEPVPPVIANEARLGQVFLNLIVNAAQAIPPGAASSNQIGVSTKLVKGRIHVEISDTGPGISPEVMARLFTPFFTTKPAGVGTGLGLAICQRLTTAIGGTILVDSVLGRGTTFTVILPAGAGDAPAGDVLVAVPKAKRRLRILAIDDEPAILTVVRRALGNEHHVAGNTDAGAALQRIRGGERFDLILCDLMMPTITGMELHETLAREFPDQADAIVFITGGAFTPSATQYLEKLPNKQLEKPFAVGDLRALANEISSS
ncbi:MAG TPA: response regulator [Kofleriaceae bacterium]|jgi:PAS domain S-box-containing protein